ncbi:MAG: hypothetical protein N3A63_03825 [Bacteroidetes bacterium]|nr:hypothetical protein [Bacteroidota bacterium]
MKDMIVVSLMIIFLTSPSLTQSFNILCPYIGSITSEYSSDVRQVRLHDKSSMAGIFFQSITPETYQWNLFGYYAPNINYGTVFGGHIAFDYYVPLCYSENKRSSQNIVAGCGSEYIHINIDANNNISPFTDFTISNSITVPYVRAGYQHIIHSTHWRISLFPWIGVQYQHIRGKLRFEMDPPGPTPLFRREENIGSNKYFALTGLNVNTRFFHVLEIEAKYYGAFRNNEHHSNASWMVNVYLSRSLGLSYRGKYIEFSNGYDIYNIVGIALIL